MARTLGLSKRDRRWAEALRGRGPRNGAMVALDYRTGDVLAYVGSAGYYREALRSGAFDPKYDVLSQGYRQPGSAFKPVIYATAFHAASADAGQPAARRHHPVRPRLGAPRRRSARARSRPRPRAPCSSRSTSRPSAPCSASAPRTSSRPPIGWASSSRAATAPSGRPGWRGALGTVEVRPLDLDGGLRRARQRRPAGPARASSWRSVRTTAPRSGRPASPSSSRPSTRARPTS